MESVNLYLDDTNSEFERLVWLLIENNGYLRTSWSKPNFSFPAYRVWLRTVVADVPSARLDAVLDAWLG